MKSITVQQPWANAIIFGQKDIENRTRIGTWRGLTGQRIAIHAGLRVDDDAIPLVNELTNRILTRDLIRGAIIGLVTVTDVHWSDGECCDPWGQHGPGVCHLVLDQPRPVQPIYCRGALGAWRLDDVVRQQLEAVGAR